MRRLLAEASDRANFERFFELRTRMARNNTNVHMHMAEAHVQNLRSLLGGRSVDRGRKLEKRAATELLRAVDTMLEECGDVPSNAKQFVAEVREYAHEQSGAVM